MLAGSVSIKNKRIELKDEYYVQNGYPEHSVGLSLLSLEIEHDGVKLSMYDALTQYLKKGENIKSSSGQDLFDTSSEGGMNLWDVLNKRKFLEKNGFSLTVTDSYGQEGLALSRSISKSISENYCEEFYFESPLGFLDKDGSNIQALTQGKFNEHFYNYHSKNFTEVYRFSGNFGGHEYIMRYIQSREC
ncbi:hypothetical protein GOV14_00335, partial [Candidatus Pacearchaeota archaeon]|nr:hypothetical protein [Candidatus Pacearchaeota archaeon]